MPDLMDEAEGLGGGDAAGTGATTPKTATTEQPATPATKVTEPPAATAEGQPEAGKGEHDAGQETAATGDESKSLAAQLDEALEGQLGDLTPVDDAPLSQEYLDGLKGLAEKHGLTGEQLQALKGFQEDMVREYLQDQEAGKKQRLVDWEEQVRNDPEIGGEHLPGTLRNYSAFMAQASPEFRELLDETDYKLHPVVVRELSKFGAQFVEPSRAATGGRPAGTSDPLADRYAKSRAQRAQGKAG